MIVWTSRRTTVEYTDGNTMTHGVYRVRCGVYAVVASATATATVAAVAGITNNNDHGTTQTNWNCTYLHIWLIQGTYGIGKKKIELTVPMKTRSIANPNAIPFIDITRSRNPFAAAAGPNTFQTLLYFIMDLAAQIITIYSCQCTSMISFHVILDQFKVDAFICAPWDLRFAIFFDSDTLYTRTHVHTKGLECQVHWCEYDWVDAKWR